MQRRLEGVLRAIENGAWNSSLQTRLTDLENRQEAVRAQIAGNVRADTPVVLHPNAADIYKRKVADLEASLAKPEICLQAGEALAALIAKIVLIPADDQPDHMAIELHGDLAAILSAAGTKGRDTKADRPGPGARNGAGPGASGHLLSVVAGAGFEPATFRL